MMNNSTYPNNPQQAIFVPVQKCPYHVTFDLDLDNTLDAGLPGDNRVQVWSRSGHLPARRSDARVHYVHYVHRDEQITILGRSNSELGYIKLLCAALSSVRICCLVYSVYSECGVQYGRPTDAIRCGIVVRSVIIITTERGSVRAVR